MYNHTLSVYNNSCLTVPRNPNNDKPQTLYDQKFLHDLHNEVTKNLNQKMKATIIDSTKNESNSFIDFYDSIPEYHEINHLSNQEFYKKLERLKEKQKEFNDYLKTQIKFDLKDSEWIDDYKHLRIDDKDIKSTPKQRKSSLKPFCPTPIPKRSFFDDDYLSDRECNTKPPSRRSVRIETPSTKSSPDLTMERSYPRSFMQQQPDDEKTLHSEWGDLTTEENTPLPTEIKSAPSSPMRNRKTTETDGYDGITIPKPFQMTVRDEENKIVDELFLKINKPKEEKPQQFRAHNVPIESQIPLFDKIMEDQQRRSFIAKEKRKAALQAEMKPFSFTRRDEEIQELSKQFSKSLPCVYNDEVPLKIKKFKAKPIPKNLFSNYIYKKMHEDEFYRALQKKVRAEEMLKHASLPPSMAKREKSKPKEDAYHDQYERELEELKKEFISTSPRPFKLKSGRRDRKSKKHSYRSSSATSKSSKCSSGARTISSLDMSSINRSNLAAVLRIQSARRRLELDMMKKLEEAKLQEEARWREKIMRKKPVWQALAYSHEEDLAMRLQLRRDEEKLRHEEHRLRMQQMLGRVNQQPTLFERQSQIRFPKTKRELIDRLHQEYSVRRTGTRNHISLIEMKDEAIQASVDDPESQMAQADSDTSCEEQDK